MGRLGASDIVLWGYILGLYWDNGKENGNYYNGLYRDYRVYTGVILGIYRGYIGIMEKKMETTIVLWSIATASV